MNTRPGVHQNVRQPETITVHSFIYLKDLGIHPLALPDVGFPCRQHTLFTPNFTSRTATFGVKYPVLAASSLAMWVIGRVAYSIGYSTGEPDKVRPT